MMSGSARFEINEPEVKEMLTSNEIRADVTDVLRKLWSDMPTSEKYIAKTEIRNGRWRGYIINNIPGKPGGLKYEAKYGNLSALLRKRNV
jgi:hypothetical protein